MRRPLVLAITLAAALAWVGLLTVRLADRRAAAVHTPVPHTSAQRPAAPSTRPQGSSPAGSPAIPPTISLPWPRQGQAAVTVLGTGWLRTSGASGPVPIASVAKVMTAYLVLRAHPLDGAGFTVTITEADVADEHRRAADDESVVPVAAGEVLDERQLLEALLLPSGNNIAVLLAEHESGSVAAFVDRMNATARALHMDDTTYTDPSGLDAATASTAADQLRLVSVAMRLPDFAGLVAQRRAQLPVAGVVHNTNPLLGSGGYVGVKTGSDDAAGGCLAFASVRTVGGRRVEVLGVVLGQPGPRLIDSAAVAARRLTEALYPQFGRAVSGR